MNDVMSRRLFKYCQDNLHANRSGKLKRVASSERLNRDYGFGCLDDKFCYFTDDDKNNLIERVKLELQVHIFRDNYPVLQSKTNNAKKNRNEKVGALKVTEGFVLLNSLESLCLNKQTSKNCLVRSLGNFICAADIETVEHQQIVMVENLEVMANLARLNLPKALQNALWLYRGDKQKHQQTGTANTFFRRFKTSNQLIFFGDFDPKGLEMAFTSGAALWLTLKQKQDITLPLCGFEHEWFNQQDAKSYLNNSVQLSEPIATLFASMNHAHKTLKQEHMVAHSLPLALYPLKIITQ